MRFGDRRELVLLSEQLMDSMPQAFPPGDRNYFLQTGKGHVLLILVLMSQVCVCSEERRKRTIRSLF